LRVSLYADGLLFSCLPFTLRYVNRVSSMPGEALVKRRARRISNSSATALAITAAIATTGASAQGVEGTFGLAAMVHTPDWANNAQVAPWDGKSDGEFAYRAIPCAGNASHEQHFVEPPDLQRFDSRQSFPGVYAVAPVQIQCEGRPDDGFNCADGLQAHARPGQ